MYISFLISFKSENIQNVLLHVLYDFMPNIVQVWTFRYNPISPNYILELASDHTSVLDVNYILPIVFGRDYVIEKSIVSKTDYLIWEYVICWRGYIMN